MAGCYAPRKVQRRCRGWSIGQEIALTVSTMLFIFLSCPQHNVNAFNIGSFMHSRGSGHLRCVRLSSFKRISNQGFLSMVVSSPNPVPSDDAQGSRNGGKYRHDVGEYLAGLRMNKIPFEDNDFYGE